MSGAGFMRRQVIKIKDPGKHPRNPHIVRDAARHNLREIQAERGVDSHIDATRSCLNEVLVGPSTASEVAAHAEKLMREAGIDPARFREDGVRAVEVVCSLPRDFAGDDRAYFADCVTWAGDRYGGADNVVSAVVHLDEACLHCHILLVPLRDGRMAGSDMAGYRRDIIERDQIDFHQQVASKHGLHRAPRLSAKAKRELASAVVQELRVKKDPALKSAAWDAFRQMIEENPQPVADQLAVQVAPGAKRSRTMAQIFTSPGKGPRREAEPYRVCTPKNAEAYPV